MIIQMIPMSASIDPDLKKNLDNINKYGTSQTDIDNSIDSNNAFISEQIVSIVSDINLKTTGFTTLYTVPTGKKFFLSSLIIECTEATSITVESTIDLGFNDPDYNNFTDNLLLEGLLTSSDFYKATISAATKIMSAGDELKMNVVTASTGTSQTVKVYVSGLLRSI